MANVVLNANGTNTQINFIYMVIDLVTSRTLATTSEYIVDSATAAHITYTDTVPTVRTIEFNGTGLEAPSGTVTGFDYKLNGNTLFSVTGLALSTGALYEVVRSHRYDQVPDADASLALLEGIDWNIDLSGSTQSGVMAGTGGDDIAKLGSGSDIVHLDGGNDDIDLGAGNDVVYYVGDLGYRASGLVHIDGGSGHDIVTFTEPSANVASYITQGMTIDLSGPIELPHFAITVENVEQISGTRFADIFIGTNAGEGMGGAGGGDELTGRGGKDTLYGSIGEEDVFIYLKASDSRGARRDIIVNYEHNMDFFDLSALDPQTRNGRFNLVGEGPLKKAGDLHFIQHNERGHANDYTLIEANIDARGKPDLQIEIRGLVDLTGGDFAL